MDNFKKFDRVYYYESDVIQIGRLLDIRLEETGLIFYVENLLTHNMVNLASGHIHKAFPINENYNRITIDQYIELVKNNQIPENGYGYIGDDEYLYAPVEYFNYNFALERFRKRAQNLPYVYWYNK